MLSLPIHSATDGSHELDSIGIDDPDLMLTSEECGDSNVGERSSTDHAIGPELVLAHPAPECETLVRCAPQGPQPGVVFDVQTPPDGEVVGDPGAIVNVAGLGAFGSVMDRVEGEVGARKNLELKLDVFLPFGL